uniref:ATP synthase F0 subunit 8 n=1 Tax=Henosepilachna pusillanima TaxID=459481 RepID=W5TZE0_9CUCU|nr:ATP synthase F0 subunit 8 [Henosepilachna pusillanima]AHH29997.1 ATP synthase F0 subunit 8 [Henosepilachna pusillanima]
MPQMMPLNWMMLMMQFIMIFFMVNILIFFIPLTKPMKFKLFNKNFINWKW